MKLVLLLVVFCFAQQMPLGYTYMPKPPNLDSIATMGLPALPDTLVNPNAVDFKPKPILGGKYIQGKDTTTLSFGILISERYSVKYIFDEAAYKRASIQIAVMKGLSQEYYDKSIVAEKVYQDEIKQLRESNKRSWLEQNIGYIGFGSGILTSIGIAWAMVHISK